MTLGALLVLALGPWNREFLSPGLLSAAHGINDQNCTACHADVHNSQVMLESSSVASSLLKSDSERCLNCHNIMQFPDLAHNLPLESLLQTSAATVNGQDNKDRTPIRMWAARQLTGNYNSASQSLACSTCHNEHRGRSADIAFMDNTQCQTCHQQQFASFTNGHPEFSPDYPFVKRSGIAFNHVTHLNNYFSEDKYADNSPTDCMTCHIPDSAGRRMQTLGFDTSCASCHHHADEIHGAGLSEPSIAFLRLPSLAITTLEQHNTWLGDDPWPADAFDDEVEMTWFMILLLEVDKDVAEDMKTLRASGSNLADLSSADELTLDAAGRIVWAVKRLIYELIQGGQPALESRITRALGDQVSAQRLAAMCGLAPDNTTGAMRGQKTDWQVKLQAAQELWLPNLMTDVQRYESGERPLPAKNIISESDKPVEPADDAKENDDDALLDDDLLLDDEDLLDDDDELMEDDEILVDDDDLLDDDLLDDDLLGDDEPSILPASEAKEDINAELTKMRSMLNEFASVGQWHIDENDFSLRYRPTGHADTFLRAWLDVTADAESAAVPSTSRAIFQALGRETKEIKSPGRCMKCHSVDSVARDVGDVGDVGDSLLQVINWTATGNGLSVDRRLDGFTHAPHLNLSGLRDCTSCHALNSAADDVRQWKVTYTQDSRQWKVTNTQTDPTQVIHSFNPINKANCSQCHLPDQAGDNCLSCHNYHAGFTFRSLSLTAP